METRLLNLLVCPICKGPLEHLRPPLQEKTELVCHADGFFYPAARHCIFATPGASCLEVNVEKNPNRWF